MAIRKWYCGAFVRTLSIFALLGFGSSASAVMYVGQWSNTTFASFGDVFVDISVSPPNYTMTIDLDGNVFGGSNPAPIAFNGTLNGTGGADINVIGNPLFGDVAGSVSPTGVVDIAATNLPTAFIELFETSGTIDANAITLDYFILFSGGRRPGDGGIEGNEWAQGTLTAAAVVVPVPAALWLFGSGLLALGWRPRG